jgi:hypothetical protein
MIYKETRGMPERTNGGIFTPILETAQFSECGKYRYTLTRSLVSRFADWHVLFIMLNPSTADENFNDPTIRRCLSFAERGKYSQLTVVNLFALRATDPKELKTHSDPIGQFNDEAIWDMVRKHRKENIIAAWGANKFAQERAIEVKKKFGPFQCLGVNRDGSPKHPLYIKSDETFRLLK